MTAKGNENSSLDEAADENFDQESYHTSRDNEEQAVENQEQNETISNGGSGGAKSVDSEGEDETSDPVVVSPPSSPENRQIVEKSEPAISKDEKGAPKQRVPSFIEVGLERKATPFAIKSWAALALTLDGRDKITKVLQYTARFLGWWFTGGRHKNQSIRFTALYKTLANSRKAFRLGRSFIELEKLRPTPGIIMWHLENNVKDGGEKKQNPKVLLDRASSNIGWGPSAAEEERTHCGSLTRSLSSVAYRRMYRPMLSRMSSFFAPDEAPTTELWKVCGMSIKMLCLLLFFAGDNCTFLFSTGAFDDYSLPSKERMERRKRWISSASKRASQAYFGGALAGLLVNWYTYSNFHREKIATLEDDLREAMEDQEPEEQDIAALRVKKLKQTQFSLFLSLLKVCDKNVWTYFLNLIANLTLFWF
jgi:hypothetical protein